MTPSHRQTPVGPTGLPDLSNRTMLRVQEVAALFEVTPQHVLNLIEEGSLSAVDCASGTSRAPRTTWRIAVAEVQRFAEQRSNLAGVGFRRATLKNEKSAPFSTKGVSACPPKGDRPLATPCNGDCNEARAGGGRP